MRAGPRPHAGPHSSHQGSGAGPADATAIPAAGTAAGRPGSSGDDLGGEPEPIAVEEDSDEDLMGLMAKGNAEGRG